MKHKLLLLTLLATIFSGCGSDSYEEALEASQYLDSYTYESQYLSGDCGNEVIHDMNDVAYDCSSLDDRAGLDKCKVAIKGFLSMYPGLNCNVLQEGSVVTKTESFYLEVLTELENL